MMKMPATIRVEIALIINLWSWFMNHADDSDHVSPNNGIFTGIKYDDTIATNSCQLFENDGSIVFSFNFLRIWIMLVL